MDKTKKKTYVKFYTIRSNFNEILFRLCKKIIYSDENVYVNFNQNETKHEADKFLWTREKNNFVPHKIDGEKISIRDKIILFDGDYNKLSILQKFQSLIISPCVNVKKFNLFKKFLIFSYARDRKLDSSIKDQLTEEKFIVNWYDEYSPFKWKQL